MLRHVRQALTGTLLAVVAWGLLAHAQGPPPDPSDPFFDDSQVHSVSLIMNSRDWQSLQEHYLDNTYYPADFKADNNTTVRNIGIRSRGTGSRNSAKPGLRVDFDHYVTGQDFLGLKQFKLRNQTQDASNMHERIGMLLFRRLGVKAPREAFTKLSVNNTYVGLYSIVEAVDKPFLKKAFGEDSGYLYEYVYAAGDQPWFFEDRGTNPAVYVPKPFEPKTNENDAHPEKIRDLIQIVNNDNSTQFPTTIAPFVDFDNFTRHIAVENAIADQDGFNGDYGINNFYLYRFANRNLFVWIPWDKSEAFKNPSNLPIFHNFLDGDPARRNRLSRRSMDIASVRSMYLDRLLDAANSMSELDASHPADTRGFMEREIQREYDQIRDLVYTDPSKPFTNEQFEAEVERIKAFARERPVFLRSAVAAARAQ